MCTFSISIKCLKQTKNFVQITMEKKIYIYIRKTFSFFSIISPLPVCNRRGLQLSSFVSLCLSVPIPSHWFSRLFFFMLVRNHLKLAGQFQSVKLQIKFEFHNEWWAGVKEINFYIFTFQYTSGLGSCFDGKAVKLGHLN